MLVLVAKRRCSAFVTCTRAFIGRHLHSITNRIMTSARDLKRGSVPAPARVQTCCNLDCSPARPANPDRPLLMRIGFDWNLGRNRHTRTRLLSTIAIVTALLTVNAVVVYLKPMNGICSKHRATCVAQLRILLHTRGLAANDRH